MTIENLLKDIENSYPSATIKTKLFPSGSVWLTIGINDQWIEVAYRPSEGCGVSKLDENTLPFTGHDYFFSSLEETKAHILKQLAEFEE